MTDQSIAAFAMLGLAILFLIVYSWDPVHICRWTTQCPHWNLEQNKRNQKPKA